MPPGQGLMVVSLWVIIKVYSCIPACPYVFIYFRRKKAMGIQPHEALDFRPAAMEAEKPGVEDSLSASESSQLQSQLPRSYGS